MPDPFDLQRFVDAQNRVYAAVLEELRRGHKQTHWMWFVFPQLAGLGHSPMAERYAISGLDEASAYLAHPMLGPRLRECTQLTLAAEGKSAHDIFSSPDDRKFRSSMTLFAGVDREGSPFERALVRYFAGERDQRTLDLLAQLR
ncbi:MULTISPECIES: DUF1810 domain-containing protein [unclassified Ensifer]|uniref:DUF1810 domain-containing protein n=1 Tax=unclassified Ensifer TaxID=2633371 RepID=UPI000813C133|nr:MULTISPECIES: DUF1810 domain-containing protein [unclassified Ensifer]OCO98274.1 calpastatin [Ensifer sp. LC13]OCP05154.1 calpastatin [Ensifer sp. LC14]OCP14612.1 calpastatin [Ensifer sp. LC11]OCP29167.1 calpastatin [Ensifer sp. LC499]